MFRVNKSLDISTLTGLYMFSDDGLKKVYFLMLMKSKNVIHVYIS